MAHANTSKGTGTPARQPLADPALYAVVFFGGALGTAMRFGLSALNAADTSVVSARLGTFLANMAACFVYAALTTAMSQASWIRKRRRELASRGFGMGMCGGLSTLSALAIEELAAGRAQDAVGAAIYVTISFAGGLLMAWLGVHAAFALMRRRLAQSIRDQVTAAGVASGRRELASSSDSSMMMDGDDAGVRVDAHSDSSDSRDASDACVSDSSTRESHARMGLHAAGLDAPLDTSCEASPHIATRESHTDTGIAGLGHSDSGSPTEGRHA